jgi:hypothetical protein
VNPTGNSTMAIDNLTFRTAEKHVKNYGQESHDLMAAHREAMECRDCEAFLQLGIDAFDWIVRADLVIRQGFSNGHIEYSPEIDIAFKTLCKAWLEPCGYAEQWVSVQRARNYHIENLQKFRECCEQMQAISEAYEMNGVEEMPDAIAEARDRAIAEHVNGQTAEFV